MKIMTFVEFEKRTVYQKKKTIQRFELLSIHWFMKFDNFEYNVAFCLCLISVRDTCACT